MARNRKKKLEPMNPPAEETTSIRQAPRFRVDESDSQAGERKERRTLPTGLPLVGSEVLEAIGSNGTVGRAMHDVIYTPDDEKVVTRLGPEQTASVSFHSDRELADAGAEFAEDFGRDFLMAATTGEDIGEIESASEEADAKLGDPFLHVTDELEDVTDFAEPTDEDVPSRKR
jgi:hypothetical protein